MRHEFVLKYCAQSLCSRTTVVGTCQCPSEALTTGSLTAQSREAEMRSERRLIGVCTFVPFSFLL
jgi:hypothetical protein